MKKREALALNYNLNKLKEFGNTKFKYSILKNISILKSIISTLEQIEKENKAILTNFEKDRNDLIIKIGKKDGENIVIDTNDQVMLKSFNDELKEIVEKHKESIEKYEIEYNQFKEILEEEIEDTLIFRSISIEDCPEDNISSEQLELLLNYNIIN